MRILAFSRFDVKQKLSLDWKHLSGERKAAEDLLELGFPPSVLESGNVVLCYSQRAGRMSKVPGRGVREYGGPGCAARVPKPRPFPWHLDLPASCGTRNWNRSGRKIGLGI